MTLSASNLGAGGYLEELSTLAITSPRTFAILTKIMSIQPELDPAAGSGAMFPIALWFQMDLTDDQRIALLDICNDDPELLYLVLRANSLRYWVGKELAVAIELRYLLLANPLKFVRSFLPSFKGRKFSETVKRYERTIQPKANL